MLHQSLPDHGNRPAFLAQQGQGLAGDEFCDRCAADWAQAERYHELARALGTVEDWPTIAGNCGSPPAGGATIRAIGG